MYLEDKSIDILALAPKVQKKKNGYSYMLIKVGQRAMIYEQIITKDVKRYEVSLMRVKKARTIMGKQIPPKIWFPNDEAFGVWAWTCLTLDRAMNRFQWLESDQECDFSDWSKIKNGIK